MTGSSAASAILKLPIRMPSGTAKIEAMMKPDMISVTLTLVFTSSEPSLMPLIAAITTASGVGRKSLRTSSPYDRTHHSARMAAATSVLTVR